MLHVQCLMGQENTICVFTHRSYVLAIFRSQMGVCFASIWKMDIHAELPTITVLPVVLQTTLPTHKSEHIAATAGLDLNMGSLDRAI